MPVRIHYKITATVSSTEAEEKDLANQQWEVVSDANGEGGSWKTRLQAGDVDVPLNLGNLANARFVAIRTTSTDPTNVPGPVSIRRNLVTGEQITIVPVGLAKEGHFILATDTLTALYATNSATTEMDVTVVAVGD